VVRSFRKLLLTWLVRKGLMDGMQRYKRGWFMYFQDDDGAIPVAFHAKEDDPSSTNFKKRIISDIQADFKRKGSRKEADPTSTHRSRYINDASMEGVTEQGTVLQTRVVDSSDVIDYASHIEPDQVKVRSKGIIQYKAGVPQKASGSSSFSVLTEVHVPPGKDVEADFLEADTDSDRRKRRQAYNEARRPDPTYDENSKMNHLEASGSFSLTQVRQERIAKSKRDAVDFLSLPEAVQSSLMAIINHTHADLEHIVEIRSELGSITDALEELHNDIEHDEGGIAQKIGELLELEETYGPQGGQKKPAIESVLGFLKKLGNSEESVDVEMRDRIYSMLAPAGSQQSQKALLEALEKAKSEEEHLSVVMYIAFVRNPHLQLITEIENQIGADVHSNDPLLLAYGCLVPRTSPELQQHMTQFLLKRLQQAGTNEQSLVHHLHSLGNAGSPKSAEAITTYLEHPSTNVQLITISALRYLLNETLVQEALTDLLLRPDITDDHIDSIMSSLKYGLEHARENHVEKPFNSNLASALVLAAIENTEGQFDSSILHYLSAVDTHESHQLAEILQSVPHSNSTRLRRGTNWADKNKVYDLVEPLNVRMNDQRLYRYSKNYIWGKKMGVSDGNIQVAAGGFMGVSDAGDYKLFGHAVIEANAFGRRYRALDLKILRQKSRKNTHSVLYIMVAGKTLKNIDVWEPSSVCKKYTTTLRKMKSFPIFRLTHSLYIYVGVLKFRVTGNIQFSNQAFVKFCENRGSSTASAGLTPTATFKIGAKASANILVSQALSFSVQTIINVNAFL
jgi:hypothetical protein